MITGIGSVEKLVFFVCVVCYSAAKQHVCWPITSDSDGVGIIWVPERGQLSQITSPIRKADSTSELYNWSHCTQAELCSALCHLEYQAQNPLELLNSINSLSYHIQLNSFIKFHVFSPSSLEGSAHYQVIQQISSCLMTYSLHM